MRSTLSLDEQWLCYALYISSVRELNWKVHNHAAKFVDDDDYDDDDAGETHIIVSLLEAAEVVPASGQ